MIRLRHYGSNVKEIVKQNGGTNESGIQVGIKTYLDKAMKSVRKRYGYEIIRSSSLLELQRQYQELERLYDEQQRELRMLSFYSQLNPLVDKNRNCIYSVCRKNLKIAAVTMVYNEALILPYFLRHYEHLDEIHVLYETDSTDETLEILNQAKNLVIHKCHIEGGLDDTEKLRLINNTLHRIKADWVYVVDPDEFIFPFNESSQDFLKRQYYDVVRAAIFQVYRHRTDKDLDPSLPPVPQRIHGDPDLFSLYPAEPNRSQNYVYVKPIVVRPLTRIRFLNDQHFIEGDVQISPEFYIGAHWQMADPSIALRRRMERKARMSERNKDCGAGQQNWNITEEWIRAECDRHLDDPIIEVLSCNTRTSAGST